MLLSNRIVRNVFEAAEDAGLSRADLVRPLGIPADVVADGKIEWATLTASWRRRFAWWTATRFACATSGGA
jgi:hypothetical protein